MSVSEKTNDKPTSSAFFVTGGTMPVHAPSYLERQADEQLYQTLKNGQLCFVLNARQMGKSSLINRAALRLRNQGVAVAQLDLTAIGQNLNASQWYYGLLNQLGQQTALEDELDDFWFENESLGPMQRFFTAIKTVVLPALGDRALALSVDEIDAVRSITAFSTDEFFAGIRSFFLECSQDEQSRIGICLLGTATPADLVQDVHITPFNIGKRIELRDFTEREAAPLAGFLPGGQAMLSRILYWTGGHPFLTQTLCQACVEAPSASVDALVTAMYLAAGKRDSDDNLKLVSNRLLLSDCDRYALLRLYGRIWQGRRVPDEETNSLCDVLKLSGVVRVEGGLLRVRNQIYRRIFDGAWIEKHLPDADVRRQKAAFRRGAALTGALAGIVLGIIGLLAGYASRQAALVEARTKEARHSAYATNLAALYFQLRDSYMQDAFSFLKRTAAYPERGFEWGYLHHLFHLDRLTLQGHTDRVASVSFAPDGRQILTTGADGKALFWEVATGRQTRAFTEDSGVSCGAISPDGREAALSLKGGTVVLRDLATGSLRWRSPGSGKPSRRVVFSPDGRQVAVSSDGGTARILDRKTGQTLRTLTAPAADEPVTGIAYAPDGRLLAAVTYLGHLYFFDPATGKRLRSVSFPEVEAAERPLSSVCFSPDGKLLAVGGWNKSVRLLETANGRSLRNLFGHTGFVYAIAFSPDGRRIASAGEDRTARLWDVATGLELASFRGHSDEIFGIAISPDGKRLATASFDRTAKLWDTENTAFYRALSGLPKVTASSFSPDGRELAVVGTTGPGKVIDPVTGKTLFPLTGHTAPTGSVAFSPDGSRIATGSDDHTVVLYDGQDGKVVKVLRDYKNTVECVAFSPDGRWLLSGDDDRMLSLRDAATGQPIRTFLGHEGAVNSCAFTPDGKTIVSSSEDKTVRLWDAATGKCLRKIDVGAGVLISVSVAPDGKRLATGGWDGTVHVFEIATGRRLWKTLAHSSQAMCVRFTPDGKRVVSGGQDGSVKVLDSEYGDILLTLPGPSGNVLSVAFSPDGTSLFAGGLTSEGRLWTADPTSPF